MTTMTHSERFAQFLQELRDSGTQLDATNGQIAVLIADALDLLEPMHDDEDIAQQLDDIVPNPAPEPVEPTE